VSIGYIWDTIWEIWGNLGYMGGGGGVGRCLPAKGSPHDCACEDRWVMYTEYSETRGAELYYDPSGDLRETQMLLDHARLDRTSIYMKQPTGDEHRHWQAMVNALRVGA